jgi:hypothetical protein
MDLVQRLPAIKKLCNRCRFYLKLDFIKLIVYHYTIWRSGNNIVLTDMWVD